MIAKKSKDPVGHLLVSLDEGPESESYSTPEIEALPIMEVRQRLDELGVDWSVPGYIQGVTTRALSPAQKVLDALDERIDPLSPEEVEEFTPEEVRLRLNSIGLNYLAGIEEVCELTATVSNGQQHDNYSLNSLSHGIWTRLRIAVVKSLPRRWRLPLPSLRTWLRDWWLSVAVPSGVALALALTVGYLLWPLGEQKENADKSVSHLLALDLAALRATTKLEQMSRPGVRVFDVAAPGPGPSRAGGGGLEPTGATAQLYLPRINEMLRRRLAQVQQRRGAQDTTLQEARIELDKLDQRIEELKDLQAKAGDIAKQILDAQNKLVMKIGRR